MKIGSIKLDNWLAMAPLAGVTNLPFRLLVRRLGAGLVATEMVSAMGLVHDQRKTHAYIKSHLDEKPLSVQIFGARPDVMAKAAQIVIDAGADIVDINMGCPVKKVTRTGAGAALLQDLKQIEQMVSAVRVVCSVPLTVKIRSGWSRENPVACEAARVIENCGSDALTIHPRYRTEFFSGCADWGVIRRIKEQVSIPVIGNGDVVSPSDALKMREETGCDGVMIGRAAMANPWIFRQILQMEKGETVQIPDLTERRGLIMEHYDLLSESMGEHKAALNMRGLLLRYTKGFAYSSRFRGRITSIKDLKSLASTMDEYFSILGSHYQETKD